MKRKVGKVTLKEVIDKTFMAGVFLGFDLGGFGERVAPMLAGKKNPKEIEEILREEFDDIFQRYEADERKEKK